MAEDSAKASTVKGYLVRNHLKEFEKEAGTSGLKVLRKRYGKPFDFENNDWVAVSEEAELLGHMVDILSSKRVSDEERDFETGKLHFKYFSLTPLAVILFSLYREDLNTFLLNLDKIAGHVFGGLKISSQKVGKRSVRVLIENSDYPLKQFEGFFTGLLAFAGFEGEVEAKSFKTGMQSFIVSWKGSSNG